MGRRKTTGRVYKSKGLSMDPELLRDAEERAASLKLSFSDYVRRCLVQDISSGGKFVIEPTPAPTRDEASFSEVARRAKANAQADREKRHRKARPDASR